MILDELHKLYLDIDQNTVVKEGDSVSFSEVNSEIGKLFSWELDFYGATSYREQLPEATLTSITNEFHTAILQFREITRLRSDAASISTLAQQKEDRINGIKNLYRTIYDSFVKDYRGWKVENQEKTIENAFEVRLEEVTRRAEEKLRETIIEGQEKTEQTSDEVAQKIVGVASTNEWAKEYRRYITPDSEVTANLKTNKKSYVDALGKKKGWEKFIDYRVPHISFIFRRYWIAKIQGSAFYTGESYINLSNRWRFWRSLAYIILMVIALYSLSHTLLTGTPDKDQILDYFLHKLTLLPMVTLLIVGLIFASKNFRINLNLLEEYKHRYVVARTIQNLLLLQENGPLREQLLTKGTGILFELRSSGYMEKDTESQILEKLINNIELKFPNIALK